MLKAGGVKSKSGCEVWPTRPMKPASATSSQSQECDVDDYQQVPSYEASFSDAIQAALDSYDQISGTYHALFNNPLSL